MNVKSIIKLFIPPIILNIKNYCRKYIKKSKSPYVSTLNDITKQKEKLMVLGNGPSLQRTIDYVIRNKDEDCLVVNHFCETEYFDIIKPNYYFLADPAFFGNIDEYAYWLKEEILKCIECLVNTVSWEVNMIVPDFAKNSYFQARIDTNKNIKLFFYNSKQFSSPQNKSDFFHALDKNLITPPGQTVLNTAIYLGIFLSYKIIDVFGLDMTWHEDLQLDQRTNVLYIVDKHFYGTKKRIATLDQNGNAPAKVHEYLECSVNALKSFWDLKEYAEYKGSKIINHSDYSWVDAFERF